MAHNIARANGKDSMAYVGKQPWHKLGQKLEGDGATVREITTAAGLDYPIKLTPVYTTLKRRQLEIPNRRAVVRPDTGAVFSVVSDQWEPVQNRDWARFMERIIGRQNAIAQTAGALGQGERVWLLAKLEGSFGIKGDEIERYLLHTNGHNGMIAFETMVVPTRVVCQNTLNIATASASCIVYRDIHTPGINQRLDPAIAKAMLRKSGYYFETFIADAGALADRKMSARALDKFVADLFPLPALPAPSAPAMKALPAPNMDDYKVPAIIANKRELVKNLATDGLGNKRRGVAGTAWAAFNGAVEYADYIQGTDANRTKSLLFGAGADLKQRAWNLLTVN